MGRAVIEDKRIRRSGAYAMIILAAMTVYMLKMPENTAAEKSEESANIAYGLQVKIPASRGEIFDRNGKKLVGNTPCCALNLNYVNMDKSKKCKTIHRTLELLDEFDMEYKDNMPVSYHPYHYTDDSAKFQKFLRAYGLREDLEAGEAVEALYSACGMPDYPEHEKRRVLGVIYDLYIADFAKTGTYTLAANIDRKLMSAAASAALEFPGISIEMQYAREVLTPYAAHILGRTGKIPAGEEENYVDYPMDAVVGLDGAEYAFESLLRGQDGLCVNGDTVVQRAKSGKNVYLSIDLGLQKAAEDSLKENIENLRDRGIEAGGGAAAAVDIKTGEVLLSASSPTFDINSFTEEYVNYINDPGNPLFNRAISGTYPPGSTFKMVTALAALESGAIEPDTGIECRGVYDYYAPDYVYRCWLYRDTGEVHGIQTVQEALKNSCNCFFYEAGRLAGIDAIENWAQKFGFGQKTGIELRGEASGRAAGRVERALNGESWYPGDTLNAAIGQSDTLATPLQLAEYMAALCSGTRMKPHILLKTEYRGKTVTETAPEIAQKIDMSEASRTAIMEGLLAVTREGTAESVFADFDMDVLAKSGSAQVDGGAANAVFVLAAPAEDPQIAIAAVIEHGASGTNAAKVARDILECWKKQRNLY